jgi:SAM-dependent methyltransferase
MASFDKYAHTYHGSVERSIAFAKVDHAQVTERKVEHLLRLCADLVGPPSDQRVLDVGCGVGLTDALLVDRVGALHGIDISAESVAQAAARNMPARYTAYDGTIFPLDDSTVDVAFAICVLHHVPPEQRQHFVLELRRVVRPGGMVAVFEHNPLNPLTRVAVNRCELDDDAVLQGRRRTVRLLEDAGLHVADSAYILFTRSARWAPRTDRMLGWCPVGAQYYVAARRPSEVSRPA